MTSPTRRRFRPSTVTVSLVALGMLLIVAYLALSWLGIGKIGDPTDIGGGVMLLAGYALAGTGLVSGIIDFVRR